MTFSYIRERLEMLTGLYRSLLCKYNAIIKIIGNPIPSYSSPSKAQSDATLAVGSFYYTDGSGGGFPPGQLWIKI